MLGPLAETMVAFASHSVGCRGAALDCRASLPRRAASGLLGITGPARLPCPAGGKASPSSELD